MLDTADKLACQDWILPKQVHDRVASPHPPEKAFVPLIRRVALQEVLQTGHIHLEDESPAHHRE